MEILQHCKIIFFYEFLSTTTIILQIHIIIMSYPQTAKLFVQYVELMKLFLRRHKIAFSSLILSNTSVLVAENEKTIVKYFSPHLLTLNTISNQCEWDKI